ncbi:hypothetical protein AVEN_106181-1 [Araneus ventricosus]|uniref:t-SNARE coiled-coil homology domain-containing protein n=1 Tax=Araneus ventricosus TaxID=182803 RepID=A0A4Y2PLJ1_ARAVE|nr:hypothetical protein AVEN_106181-1 [Araneus ventricosus]
MTEMEGKFEELLAFMKEMKEGQEEMKQRQEDMQTNILNVIITKVDAIVEKVEKNEERLGKVERKFDTIEEKFDAIEDKVDTIQQNFGKLEQEIDKLKKVERIHEGFEDYTENRIQNSREPEIIKNVPVIAKPSMKLSTYDGKTSWQVYKTQFSIIAEANGSGSITKARQLAASLRAETADILRTIPEDQQLNFEILSSALELRFDEKCFKDYSRLQLKTHQQRPNETLQELAMDIERLSHLAFSDCSTEVRETSPLQYLIDSARDLEIQKAL